MEITTTSLAHLGLVAGIFDELDIADIIDSTIPKNRVKEIYNQRECSDEYTQEECLRNCSTLLELTGECDH